MNQKSDHDNTGSSGQDDASAAGQAEDHASDDAVFDEEDVVAEPPAKPSRLPLIVSIVAVVLAALALAGIALELREPDTEAAGDPAAAEALASVQDAVAANQEALGRIRDLVDPLEQSLAAVEQRISRLAADDAAAAADIDALERRINQQLTALESVPSRIASIERTLSALRGMSTGAREAWLLAQAEYFLQVANTELELARNPAIAARAMEMADERLLSIGDPGLTDVRRTLSAELRELEALDMPDVSGTALTLAGLSRVVESLPIRQELLTRSPGEDGDAAGAPGRERSGPDRALETLKDAFSGIVSVRRTDEQAEPLISPEAAYFLRTNLALQLQAARLALLRGEQALFEQSVDDAEAWLREYYDTGAAPVTSALATLGEVRGTSIGGDLPDISGSLRRLRQYIAFTEAGGAGDSSEADEPQQ